MKNSKKISSVLTVTLSGVLLTSPFSYVKADETTVATPRVAAPVPEASRTESIMTAERTTTTTEESSKEKVVTRWVDERYKSDKKKDLKPKEEGEKEAPKGKDIEGYEFVETDDTDPKEVLHIYKKKEVTYKWVTKKEDKEDDEEVLSEKKSIEDVKHEDIKKEDEDKFKDLEFDKKETSKDKLTVTFIYKKKGEKSSPSASSKSEEDKSAVSTKDAETTKEGDSPKTTEAPKVEDESTKEADDSTKPTDDTTTSTVSTTVDAELTTKVTTATNTDGAQIPLVSETSPTPTTTTKAGKEPTPPQFTSIFINLNNGFEIISRIDGVKTSIAIDGYGFVRTEVSEDGKEYRHYYTPSGGDKESKKMTVWQDVYSGEYIISSKHGEHNAGKIEGYTYVDSKSLGDVTIHYFKKSTKVDYYYNWAYHVDIDTGELIYWNNYNSGWYHYSRYIEGYVYVDTDSWRTGDVVYHTHYYKKVAKPVTYVDPAKVFTVWVDEHYNQIVPSRMGSHEAGELEGYEFDRTVSINSGYGIAHVFKKTDGERLVGKDKDMSIGYRVKSMLPRTSAKGGTNYLPLGIAGVVGAAVGAGIYYVLRRKNNNQNNNNFPPFPGQ